MVRRIVATGVLVYTAFTWAVIADQHPGTEGREAAVATPFAFAFIGDMPYGAPAEVQFERVIDDINADRGIRFVMHAGDIKAGSERCDDSLIVWRFEQYQRLDRPFVYTPGDNEWTDCHRTNNGSYNPLERLAFLRSVFFPNPAETTGARRRAVHSQAEQPAHSQFVENVWFRENQVVFATAHVVGSNNDLDPWSGIDPADSYGTPRADRLAEFDARQQAVLAWLDEVFAAAANDRAVFLMIQANPNFERPSSDQQRLGFNPFLSRLAQLSAVFARPVVLAHGDNHVFFIDKPTPNLRFSRIQTFGSNQVHWVKVHVDPQSSGVFSFEQMIVSANLQ